VDYRRTPLLIVIVLLLIPVHTIAQGKNSYQLIPAPDLWYNTIDGVRVGVRVIGEMEDSFKDGPHRLDAGVWLGTNFPSNPISYYLNYTEPIPAISSFGNEGSIEARSSIRTGFSKHMLALNKRWQKGFDELKYQEVQFFISQEKMYESAYRPFPTTWNTNWNTLIGLNYRNHIQDEQNQFEANVIVQQQLNNESPQFFNAEIEVWNQHSFKKNVSLNNRVFFGTVSDPLALQYQYTASHAAPISWMSNGISRAKGTIPQTWIENGIVQVSGGANLRGYTDTKYGNLQSFRTETVLAFNNEFEFPNPISSSLSEGILGDFVFLKSYLFTDIGTVFNSEPVLADAGIGLQFSINIPDFLGKPRGFAFRYEVPFWISEPDLGDSNFKYRNVIGFGAVIAL